VGGGLTFLAQEGTFLSGAQNEFNILKDGKNLEKKKLGRYSQTRESWL
jgi:hypothetical protein